MAAEKEAVESQRTSPEITHEEELEVGSPEIETKAEDVGEDQVLFEFASEDRSVKQGKLNPEMITPPDEKLKMRHSVGNPIKYSSQ